MALDRIVALIFLVVSVAYGYAAFNYPLLPFERNMPFLPNTLPMALSVLGALTSLFILLAPRSPGDGDLGTIDAETVREFELGRTFALVACMVAYAIGLRPVGFIAATVLFIVLSAVALGERRFTILIPIAAVAAGGVWYLVQETLGIFLHPWPSLLD